MKPTPYAAPWRPAVVVDVPETVAEAEGTVSCPVYSCRLPGRACAARHLSGVAGHPGREACGRCPAGLARAALLDVRAPTPAEVLRELKQPGSANPMTEVFMNDAIDKVLAALAKGTRSAAEIRQATGLGESVVKDALQQLKRLGRVALEGAGRSARWALMVATGAHIEVANTIDHNIVSTIDPEPPAVDVVPVVEERDPTGALERRRRTLIGRVLVAIGREHLLIEGPVGIDALVAEVERVLAELRQEAANARHQRDTALGLRETYNIPNDYRAALGHLGRAFEAVGKAMAAMNGGNHE